MKLTLNIGIKELLKLVDQLPSKEKKRLIDSLHKSIQQNSNQAIIPDNDERQLGRYGDKNQMTEDFNEPLDDFNPYMQ